MYNANYLLFIRDNGNVGIGNSGDANTKVWISGNLKVNSTIYTSDQRFKMNVQKINFQLDNLSKIKTYQYNFIPQAGIIEDSVSVTMKKDNGKMYNFDQNLHFGMMAQEIEKVHPNLVSEVENGYLGINYVEFIPLLIQSIQELNQKIIVLENELEQLKR